MPATDAAIKTKGFGSGMATLINTNDEMKIINTVRSLEKSGLLVKDVSETEAKNEAKEQKEVFLGML